MREGLPLQGLPAGSDQGLGGPPPGTCPPVRPPTHAPAPTAHHPPTPPPTHSTPRPPNCTPSPSPPPPPKVHRRHPNQRRRGGARAAGARGGGAGGRARVGLCRLPAVGAAQVPGLLPRQVGGRVLDCVFGGGFFLGGVFGGLSLQALVPVSKGRLPRKVGWGVGGGGGLGFGVGGLRLEGLNVSFRTTSTAGGGWEMGDGVVKAPWICFQIQDCSHYWWGLWGRRRSMLSRSALRV